MSQPDRGFYIALEGIEGAGKSTVAAVLCDLIADAGHNVMTVREPGGTPTGEKVRHVLLDPDGSVAPWPEALLFAAARAQLAVDIVEPALQAGTWVVTDRSVYSSLAYQGAGRGLGTEQVRAVNAPGLGPTWPDLVALLQLGVADGLSRQQVPDRIGAAGHEFLDRVAHGFLVLSESEPERFVVVDATQPVDDVAAAIWKVARDRGSHG
ncbi:MAG: dTMP kinase [bacterium]|nr:dTMP kinase [bacterium]